MYTHAVAPSTWAPRVRPGRIRDDDLALPALPGDRSQLTPSMVMGLQRTAGNAAVSRMLADGALAPAPPRPTRQPVRRPVRPVVQRCGSTPPSECGCHGGGSTEDQLSVQRAKKKPKSVAVDGKCQPTKTITGTFLAPIDKLDLATSMVNGSKAALAGNGIDLSMDVKGFLNMGETGFGDSIESNGEVCQLMRGLGPVISKGGVVVLMVPVNANDVCGGSAEGCYKGNFGSECGGGTPVSKLIVINSFTARDCTDTIVAHEIGHAAGYPGHRDRSGKQGDYMGFTCPRDHYHENDLPLVCGARLRF